MCLINLNTLLIIVKNHSNHSNKLIYSETDV